MDTTESTSAAKDAGAQDTRTPVRGWVIFGLYSAITTFGAVVSFTFGVMLPEIRKDIAISPAAAGLLASMFSLFNSLAAVPIANWFSRYNPVRLVAAAGALGAVFLLLQSFAWSLATLFGARMLFVVFQSIKNPARSILMQQWLPLRSMGLANGMSFTIHGITQTFSIAIAVFVVEALGGWRQVYVALAAMMTVQVALWLAVARQRRTASFERQFSAQYKTPMRALLKYRHFWIMAIGLFAACLPWAAFLTFLPTFLQDYRHLSAKTAGVTTGLLYAGLTVAAAAAGVLDRRVPDRRHLVTASGIILLAAPLLLLNMSSPRLIMTIAFVNGLGWGMLPIIQTLPFHLPDIKPREIAVLSSVIMGGTGLGFGLGPLVTGFLQQTTGSLFAALLTMSVFPVLTVAAGFLYPKPARASEAQPTAAS